MMTAAADGGKDSEGGVQPAAQRPLFVVMVKMVKWRE